MLKTNFTLLSCVALLLQQNYALQNNPNIPPLGNVATHLIWKRVHDAQRLARLDWVSGYIDLKQYRRQVVEGILMTYAADASPALQVRLSKALSELDDA